ncbi:amidase signature domain-containing protein [Schizophyllum amplum]|uniref:amidase n=1 Tax=Schizophyllum amplum TaxID=97359 RepID=A0A550CK42_9AGAR|nr:amidase signature domain-containing protein [Auriculariopsis ampla]
MTIMKFASWGLLLGSAAARATFQPYNGVDDLGARALLPRNASFWGDIVATKVAARDALIPAEYLVPQDMLPDPSVDDISAFPFTSGLFTDLELEITESTASEVVKRVACGDWTAEEVLEATIKRAVVAQQLFNPLSEILFERGRAQAKKLDAYFAETGKTMGPLHGLPISLKDQFRFKGVDATIGYVSWANRPAEKDSLTVTALEELGAVLWVKTNIPTSLMSGETINNIFNETKNPFNRRLTPGGSSGGESSLVGFHGSFIGFGTDIAGSIRIPCTNTGLWCVRPSIGRCSYENLANSLRGEEAITSTCGPMGRSPDDLKLVFSSLVNKGLWEDDPNTIPMPWREDKEQLPEKLVFGWANGDGHVQPWPPVQRGMLETKAKLEAAGHEVVEWLPPSWYEHNTQMQNLFSVDGHLDIQTDFNASGEPFLPTIASYLAWVAPEDRPTVYESWQLVQVLQNYTQSFRDAWQGSANITSTGRPIDALIMPATSNVAKERGIAYPYGYGNLSPMLDLTTGVFPVTRTNSSIDVVNATFVPLNDADAKNQALYDDPTTWEHAPVGLQLIGRRLEEEKIVAMLKVIELALKA